MSYLVAAYAIAIAGIALYSAWLARARRTLVRELTLFPQRVQNAVDSRAARAL